MKKLGLALVILGCFLGCKSTQQEVSGKFKVALALGKGGVDDKSFNASAYQGGVKARDEFGIELRHVEMTDDSQMEPTLKTFARKNFDLIVAIGFTHQEAVTKAAKAFPNSRFAIVDAVVDAPNVASLMFQEHEGSYLAGALAAMKSESGVIGFIGGMDNPLIRRFELGYREGAKKQSPHIKIITNYVGTSGEAWNNPTKGKELAVSQIGQKADVIYHAAGASGLGVFDAVEEVSKKTSKKVYAIGVDSNQNWVKPGLILTSMLKRVDVAVFDIIKATKAGNFKAGRRNFGLENSGIDLAMDEFNSRLMTDDMARQITNLKQQIQTSKIQVSDFYKIQGINQ